MNLTPVQKILHNNGKKFESEKEISNAVEALLKLNSTQQGVQWTLATAWRKLVALFRRQSY